MKIQNYKNFTDQNEGIKNIIGSALLLLNLGLLSAQDLKQNKKEITKVVQGLSQKDIDSLKIIDHLKTSDVIYLDKKNKIMDINSCHHQFLQYKNENKTNFDDFLKVLHHLEESESSPIKAHVFLISPSFDGVNLLSIPLYQLEFNAKQNQIILSTTDLTFTKFPNISVDVNTPKIGLKLLTNPAFTTFGITKQF